MTGGYILLDFTKFKLDSNIESLDDLNETYEITKDEYDDIMKKAQLSQDTCKPLIIKTSGLYDDYSIQNTIAFNIYKMIDKLIIPYYDFNDNKMAKIHIMENDGKYYAFTSLIAYI